MACKGWRKSSVVSTQILLVGQDRLTASHEVEIDFDLPRVFFQDAADTAGKVGPFEVSRDLNEQFRSHAWVPIVPGFPGGGCRYDRCRLRIRCRRGLPQGPALLRLKSECCRR